MRTRGTPFNHLLWIAALTQFGFVATAAPANPTVTWPQLISAPTSTAQCQNLDAEYLQLQTELDASHNKCIHEVGPAPIEAGPTCSRVNCQGWHDLLYTELGRRRSFAVNSCQKQVSASKQQCLGRISTQQNEINRRQSALKESFLSHCVGKGENNQLGQSCRQSQNQISNNENAASILVDRQHSECN